MMVNCDVCSIVLSENDLPFHNNGKKHLKNLVRKRLEMTAPKTINANTSSINDKNEKLTNQEKESTLERENSLPVKSSSPTKSEDVDSTASKPDAKPVKENDGNKKKSNEHPEQLKKRKKRKFKEYSPCLLPVVCFNNWFNFDQQVHNFIMQVQQSQNEWTNIKLVLQDVEFTFQHVIRGVKPVLYGSTFTGLAFKTSDIDVYLLDPNGGFPDREFIQREGSIIYRYRLFSHIVRIPTARVPVIKATHKFTGIELDISVTSAQAVANSCLLRFLLSHDWRIRSLMMLIGYFGKKFNIIGINKFSRYSINLLIIFYLQTLPFPILPPLCKIVYGAPDRPWPFAFYENQYRLMNNNKQSLAELFMGFFEFYKNFPFSSYVISTYAGEKFSHQDMEKKEILDKMMYYKLFVQKGGEKIVYKQVCIQDSLELCHNTTKGITEKVLQHFDLICTNVVEMKKSTAEKDWLTEMLNMDCTPVTEKNRNHHVSFCVKYPYSGDDWLTSIKKSFDLVFWSLGIDIDWNCSVAEDETKKTKLSPGLTFSLETKNFYPKSLKWQLNQLKLGVYNFEQFRSSLLEITQAKNQTVFSAQCFVSHDQENVIRVTMKNNCYNRAFFNMIYILKGNFHMLLTLALNDQIKN